MDHQYSVLMSVYKKEKPEFLRKSIESMMHQTVVPEDFVIVCDGPLTEDLDQILSDVKERYGKLFQIIRLPQNRGLGAALSEGLNYCKYEYVARMDSDDISVPNRCEEEMAIFKDYDVAVVGGWIDEFSERITEKGAVRTVPESSSDIRKYSRKRNPFNHPTVMFKKSAVQDVGNYQTCYGFEDYQLWVRLLNAGYKGYNIPRVLVHMRVSDGMYTRRGGLSYFRKMISFWNYMRRNRYISTADFIIAIMTRGMVSLIPVGLRQSVYGIFLRKK